MPGRKPPVPPLNRILITAEHASRRVPTRWRGLFAGHLEVLESHRGWDPGSRALAQDLSRALEAPLLAGQVSRLLVDLNRSAGHRQRFSEFTRGLTKMDRDRLEETYWTPHWRAFRDVVASLAAPALHIACHSFTPVLDGRRRALDIGLLYDPTRERERTFCRGLARAIGARKPALRVRMNQPYRGISNGIGQQHRKVWPADRFVSIELEVNQALVAQPGWRRMRRELVAAVVAAAGTDLTPG